MPWIREGECPPERCGGHCCTHVGVWYGEPDLQTKLFLKQAQTRGLSVKSGGEHAGLLLDIPQRCQFLTNDNLCALHPAMHPVGLPMRPLFCDDWPTEPAQLINDPGCGFSFRWEEEELKIG